MRSMLEAALRYAAQGWHVFPLGERGKRPLVSEEDGGRGFHDATTVHRVICDWWGEHPNANIGLAPGRSGLCVLDADGPLGESAACSRGLLDPAPLFALTGRAAGGRHLYFRHPGFRVGNRKLASKIDVRCDDGYVVLPPSVHPSGVVYRWVGRASDIRPLPAAVAEELERLQRDEPAPPVVPVPVTDPGDIDRRVRAYLERVGTRAEGDRDNTAFRVAAWLLRDIALEADVAWAYLVSWNAGNTPPLGERDLRAKLRSAAKSGRRGRGSGLLRDYRAVPAFGGFAR